MIQEDGGDTDYHFAPAEPRNVRQRADQYGLSTDFQLALHGDSEDFESVTGIPGIERLLLLKKDISKKHVHAVELPSNERVSGTRQCNSLNARTPPLEARKRLSLRCGPPIWVTRPFDRVCSIELIDPTNTSVVYAGRCSKKRCDCSNHRRRSSSVSRPACAVDYRTCSNACAAIDFTMLQETISDVQEKSGGFVAPTEAPAVSVCLLQA